MARANTPEQHPFGQKLILNQWLMKQLGIDPLQKHLRNGAEVRPFHALAEYLTEQSLEGLGDDNLHKFYHVLVGTPWFWEERAGISPADLLRYEENIAAHTLALNEHRDRPIVWKYFQWLTLLFVEIYLHHYFEDPDALLLSLNRYLERFNEKFGAGYEPVPPFVCDDLNKIGIQSATGSGKTLVMHANLLQFRHYAHTYGRDKQISRAILLTPNEPLSAQHVRELKQNGFEADNALQFRNDLFATPGGLEKVDILEITKLRDEHGPTTIATESLGDENLVLVDEGHRGLASTQSKIEDEQSAWLRHRNSLSEKAFAFEYSATFQQAVAGTPLEDTYAKSVLFDYSYRWFYEDGFGKDYQILNLPSEFDAHQELYLTAAMLKYYQQLRIFEDKRLALNEFNIEKPQWVFVGNTVSSVSGNKAEKDAATDIARIVTFFARFLHDRVNATARIRTVLLGNASTTGLVDGDGNDIFAGGFDYLLELHDNGTTFEQLYDSIVHRVFNSSSAGELVLERIKGESGEILLQAGASASEVFGIVNVGDAKGLSDHIASLGVEGLVLRESEFEAPLFKTVASSKSPVNLVVGSKKFVEGWDNWRVSLLGLMHVGKQEGAQIVQLFGRGVRLKGYNWSLKRSGHSGAPAIPDYINEVETLYVFGIQAEFMKRFRDYLASEGLPGNEQRQQFTVPIRVDTQGLKGLKTLRQKKAKDASGKTADHDYDFKKDGPVPTVGEIPAYLVKNKVQLDWFSRIEVLQSLKARRQADKPVQELPRAFVPLMDMDRLYFRLEEYKRNRGWYNLNVEKEGIERLLADSSWYELYAPADLLNPTDFAGVRRLEEVTLELLKRYCDRLYNYRKRAFSEERLETRPISADDNTFPKEREYRIVVDQSDVQTLQNVKEAVKKLHNGDDAVDPVSRIKALFVDEHLFAPVLHAPSGARVEIAPTSLNQSEFRFVYDLREWIEYHRNELEEKGIEIHLVRNLSRGKGVGFFEAGGFYPDFILWVLKDGRQYITFVEPHGLKHENEASKKIEFGEKIKDVERRVNRTAERKSDGSMEVSERPPQEQVVLNSFVLSWTKHVDLPWTGTREELEEKNILFIRDEPDAYLNKLFSRIVPGLKATLTAK